MAAYAVGSSTSITKTTCTTSVTTYFSLASYYELRLQSSSGTVYGTKVIGNTGTGTTTSIGLTGLPAGTTTTLYLYYRVSSSGAWTSASASGTVLTLPDITYSATSTSSSITLTFSITGATSYTVNGVSSVTSPKTFTSLSPNTQYTYPITATNASGTSTSSASKTTLTAAPTNLIYSNKTQVGADFSWTAPPGGADSYTISWSGTTSGSKSVYGTSAVLNTLYAGGTYTITVSGSNAVGSGDSVTLTNFTTLSTLNPPAAPAISQNASNTSTSNIRFNISAGTGGTPVTYYYQTRSSTGSYSGTDSTLAYSASAYVDVATTTNSQYYIKVKSSNADGTSLYTEYSAYSRQSSPTITEKSKTYNSITLTVSGVNGYTTTVTPSTGTPQTFSTASADLTFSASPNTAYTFSAVTAGTGLESSTITSSQITTPNIGIPSPSISDITIYGFTVSWSAIPGATGYKYRLQTWSEGWSSPIDNGSATTVSFSSWNPNELHSIQVLAYSSGGDGSYSSAISAYTLSNLSLSLSNIGSTSATYTINGLSSAFNNLTYTSVGLTSSSFNPRSTSVTSFSNSELLATATTTAPSKTFGGLSEGAVYTLYGFVKTVSGSYYYPTSSGISFTTAPGTPSVTSSTSDSLTIGFGGQASKYEVLYSTTSGGPYTILSTNPTAASATLSTLNSATKYYFKVRAYTDAGGWSNYSTEGFGTTRTSDLTGLVASSTSPSSISFTWNALSGNYTGYQYESRVNGGAWSTSQTTALPTATINTTEGSYYDFRVRGYYTQPAGTVYSLNDASIFNRYPAPSTPSLSLSNRTATSFRISWTNATQNSYTLTCKIGSTNYGTITYQTGYADIANLTPGTSYSVTLTAATNTGSAINTQTATTRPAPPTILSISNITNTSARINISAPSGGYAGGFTAIQSNNSNNIATLTKSDYDNGTHYIIVTGLIGGQQYSFDVFTSNNGLDSETVSTGNFIMQSPPFLTAESYRAATSLRIGWVGVVGATSYDLYCNGVLKLDVSNPYDVTGLDPGTVNSFYLVAKNSSGAIMTTSDTIQIATRPNDAVIELGAIVELTSISINIKDIIGNYTRIKVYRDANNYISGLKNTSVTFSLNPGNYSFYAYAEIDLVENGVSKTYQSKNSSNIITASLRPASPTISRGTSPSSTDTIRISIQKATSNYYDLFRIDRVATGSNVAIESKTLLGFNYDTGTQYVDFTGLSPGTDYYFLGYTAYASTDSLSTSELSVSTRPSFFEWNTAKTSSGTFNLTSTEWNALTSNIKKVQKYKNLSQGSFTIASPGSNFTAGMYKEARNNITATGMNPTASLIPPDKNSGDAIYADYLNKLKDSINSIV